MINDLSSRFEYYNDIQPAVKICENISQCKSVF